MFCFYFSFFFFLLGLFSFFFGLFVLLYGSVLFEFLNPMSFLFDLNFVFCFDFVSLLFFSVVSFISSVVFLYSGYYFGGMYSIEEKGFKRFLVLLFFFVISMFFLVFSYSWFLIMLGWDGLGLVSFLLVIYYNDTKSLDSGMVTVLTNRVGDCLFLLSFMFMFYCGWFSFSYLEFLDLFCFCIIVLFGSITKSAQMPFSSWLPAAMAAPTPVSSLVHSSTLVTAGVYLIVRYNFILEGMYSYLVVISILTMTFASLFAVMELDFKKVVAMSTLSQLGFMLFTVCVGNWLLGYLHMIFHAFFKSSLFLSTGNLMHFLQGNQDSRFFGNFYMSFYSKLFFSMSCLSLMGFPFSLGFYSKDSIIGLVLYNCGGLLVFLFCLSCCLTVSYSFRLLFMGFKMFSSFQSFVGVGETKMFFLPVVFLFFFNVFVGNFYMYIFLDPYFSFSFFELFIGIFIILGGFMVLKIFPKFYEFYYVLCSMGFIPYLVSKISVGWYKLNFFVDDLSWNEIFFAKGSKYFLGWYSFEGFFFMI